jgi:hypothetical protein
VAWRCAGPVVACRDNNAKIAMIACYAMAACGGRKDRRAVQGGAWMPADSLQMQVERGEDGRFAKGRAGSRVVFNSRRGHAARSAISRMVIVA